MRSLLACLLLLAAAAAPARAEVRNELTLGSWRRALRSPSANAVTDDDMLGPSLAYARDLRLRPLPALGLWAVGCVTWGGADGTMFETLSTDVAVVGLSAGGLARYRLRDHVIATARLELGTARTRLALEDAMGRTASGASWGGLATAAAGLDLLAGTSPRFSLGLRVEVGYTAAPGSALTVSPASGSDGDAILLPRRDASFGHLDLGGPFYELSLVSQF